MTAVSVIVPARGAAATIGRQLGALATQTFAGEWEVVVVVDGGPGDRTMAAARAWADRLPRLQVVDGDGPRGRSQARNRGAAVATGNLLLYCDADDEVDPGWVAAMALAAAEAELVGGYVDVHRFNPPEARRARPPYPTDHLPTPFGFLPYATAANVGIRAATLQELGGWNESYARSGDVELCWRAQLAGHRLRFVPEAVVHYRYRSALAGILRQQFGWGMADVRVYNDFRHHGLRRRPWWRVLASWAVVVLSSPKLVGGPAARSAWLQRTARLGGRLVGSARRGCWFG